MCMCAASEHIIKVTKPRSRVYNGTLCILFHYRRCWESESERESRRKSSSVLHRILLKLAEICLFKINYPGFVLLAGCRLVNFVEKNLM